MSVKNKSKDRNVQGRMDRKRTARCRYFWPRRLPSWRARLFMTRPQRRLTKAACRDIVKGETPDGVLFPLGNHKPHKYYW